jgi:hypothetical protein
MSTTITGTDLRNVLGGAEPNAYAKPGEPGYCEWLDSAISARSQKPLTSQLRKGLFALRWERFKNCTL